MRFDNYALFPHIGAKNGEKGDILAELLPQGEPDIYIEPFGGSFGVGLRAPYTAGKVLRVHNDMDIVIHEIVKSLSVSSERLFAAVFNMLDVFEYSQCTVDYFRLVFCIKDLTGTDLIPDDFYRGAAAWILKQMTMNGNCKNLSVTADGRKESRIQEIFERREESADQMKGVLAIRMDAFELLEQIRRAGRNHDREIVIYIDAPYSHKGKRTTKGDLYDVDIDREDKDIVRLAYLLDAINQQTVCKILVSEYDTPIYNSILTEKNGWKKKLVCEAYKSMSIGRAGESKSVETEYAWCNY